MPGPLPSRNPRRRNAPTIPTTKLPASGRPGRVPRPPEGYAFGAAGKAWWSWAWKLPQACAWSDGDLYVVARRAALEDDQAAVHEVEGLDFTDVLEAEHAKDVRFAIARLAGFVSGTLTISKEMRELDDRLGLTPKGFAALRWAIEDDAESVPDAPPKPAKRHLRAVDPAAVGA